ncbi:MAG: sugar transferase [Chlamydiae bacterium]|nr:sugar transferase [Chlamydiota bacterium]
MSTDYRSFRLKRFFDIFFSSICLTFGSPLYLLIMVLTFLSSKGPIFYGGWRMGQHGKLIKCWKFRTMCVDADAKLQSILQENPFLKKEWAIYNKLKDDPRLTWIGKFLRKTSLDELPQFWNVLKGDLSIVGPRPIVIEDLQNAEIEIRKYFGEKTDKILSVKPGLTCIWQVKGRNLLTFQERIAFEEKYIDSQNFVLDMKIIFKTIKILIFPKGAF